MISPSSTVSQSASQPASQPVESNNNSAQVLNFRPGGHWRSSLDRQDIHGIQQLSSTNVLSFWISISQEITDTCVCLHCSTYHMSHFIGARENRQSPVRGGRI